MRNEQNVYRLEEFIRNFAAVLQFVRIYTAKHHLSQNNIRDLHAYMQEYFDRTGSTEFVFGVVMGELISGKEVLIESSKLLKGFITLLEQRHIEKVTISRSAQTAELSAFIDILSNSSVYPVDKPVQEVLASQGISGIKIGALSTEEKNAVQGRSVEASSISSIQHYYGSLVTGITELIQKVFNRYADDKDCAMFISLVDELIQHMDENIDELFKVFGYLKARNEYEYIHSAHVALLTLIQARALHLDKSLVSRIGIAAFLHDIGKLRIPLEILNKPAHLTEEEFQQMKLHPVYGARILSGYTKTFGELPAIVCFQHHIKYNGSGYPKTCISGKELNLASRMATISDNYDAMRTSRSYRAGIPPEKVYTIMRSERGSTFDPFLLDNFFSIMGIWSPGTIVQVSNGQIGIVRSESALFLDKPVIEIFYDADSGKSIDPFIIDLEKEESLIIKQSLEMERLKELNIPIPEAFIL